MKEMPLVVALLLTAAIELVSVLAPLVLAGFRPWAATCTGGSPFLISINVAFASVRP